MCNVWPCSFHLFATVDAVLAENWSAACGHPDSSQRVAVNLILLNHPLAFLVLKHKAGSAVKKKKHLTGGVLKLLLNRKMICTWWKRLSFETNLGAYLPHRCPHAVHRGSCCVVQWGSCWFGSGFPPGRYHRYRCSLSNPVHLQICTPLLGYRWI